MLNKQLKIFDTHCHLDDKVYKDDFNQVINNAKSENILAFMSVGINLSSSNVAAKIASQYDFCYSSVGIHPHNAKNCSQKSLEELKQLAKNNKKVKAWGEIGLDFNRMFTPQDLQETCFITQLKNAIELNLPVIFHERDTKGRFLELLKENYDKSLRGVVHCFSGSDKELREYLDLNLYIGITGILTLKERGKLLRNQVSLIPIDKIVIETDAPYLTPAPFKNKTRRNEPAFLSAVLTRLSEILNIDKQILSMQIWENSLELFNIKI